jgi:hypothetical protein
VEVAVSADEKGFAGDNVPEVARDVKPVPDSDPLADAAELGAPSPLAELSEYIEETDMRFTDLDSKSDIEGFGLRAGSGN